MNSKILIAIAAGCFLSVAVMAQDPASAKAGVVYGEVAQQGKSVSIDHLESSLKGNKYEGRVTGKVVEVCQAMGCWVKLEKKDGSTVMVKALDHEFTMPKDIVGKQVEVTGKAEVKEIPEKMRRHYAEDAGKSKEEIAAIKGSSKEITIQAKGVKVMED